jgi:hypothetical protein
VTTLAAIDDLFEEVLQDLAEQAYSPELSLPNPDAAPERPLSPPQEQTPGLDAHEPLKRCSEDYSTEDLIRDSSPRIAANIELVL